MSDGLIKMHVALVGVKPADQVTLKGYFRVLLRLDAELHWVPATDSKVDLFVINENFRNAESVLKLIANHPVTSVLYVKNTQVEEGGINQDLLTLPLKQVHLLNNWLVEHVAILKKAGMSRVSTSEQSAVNNASNATSVGQDGNLSNIIDLIKTLQSRPDALFELVDGVNVVAIIDAKHELIWIKNTINKLSPSLRLKSHLGQRPDVAQSKSSASWLWQLALHSPDILLPLIKEEGTYKIRYWAKPPMGASRRDLLAVMTAIESKAKTPQQIAQDAGVSVLVAKKVLASLLLSGNLIPEVYRSLKVEVKPVEQPVVQAPPPPKAPEPPQSQGKMGFLSRLRRKLGLG